jgi:hypothetical protein
MGGISPRELSQNSSMFLYARAARGWLNETGLTAALDPICKGGWASHLHGAQEGTYFAFH